ncbi:MAG: hypothetical protein FJ267_09015, partial [Planctomycetes bacterium]|nr:hypothetical protein [Planctomycetota bacterium]
MSAGGRCPPYTMLILYRNCLMFARRNSIICVVTCLASVLSWLIPFQPAIAEVTFSKQDGSLNIEVDGKPFAIYVWNDPKTTRPYFKQVHAAGGEVQITRNHPPGLGDIPDHETFHPGIWWGFGDVGGNDYWRMKAKIIGGNFIEEPNGGVDSGT